MIATSVIILGNNEKQVAVNTISIQLGFHEQITIPCEDYSHEIEFNLMNSTPNVEDLQLVEVTNRDVMQNHHNLLENDQ